MNERNTIGGVDQASHGSLEPIEPKVFCVGRNKTGTTSMAAALELLGYRMGNQQEGELLIEDWAKRDFRSLVAYCRKSDGFQDSPFSLNFTFQAMDQEFPGSKFVLTIRDSADQWYASFVRFHIMRLRERTGENRLPTARDLQEDPYIYPGYLWRLWQLVGWSSARDDPYDKELLVKQYDEHNRLVQDYFRHRPDDLLVLNLSESAAMQRLCSFLKKPFTGQQMPKLNDSK